MKLIGPRNFQKIIDNRGQGPLSELYALAHLGLARATAMGGDVEKSRMGYEEFLKLSKDCRKVMSVRTRL